uniref:CotH protein n=1 Tax=Candidatus Kentrum sp. UNK TaxID=2126344 RepID=A0A451ALP1_9GAMM|nr:MAG: hypothetical protein BECKUNK1418G_GA0071005_11182 [Candidatus Kentron sp. UNK]VFK72064.1 MAG: hypothetical protein BECKUNK1418H_GA0071006_10948 [Candidatus Kentron sp. UNK]
MCLYCCVVFSNSAIANNLGFHICQESPVKVFRNLDQNSILNVEIRADFEKINGSQNKLDARSSGIMKIADSEFRVNIEARGNSRFKYCGFRPLTLRFQEDLDGTILDGIGKKLKSTTHCGKKGEGKKEEQWILGGTPQEQKERLLAEYYTYLMLQELDTTILDTRLVDVVYRGKEGKQMERGLGFFREPVKKMAKRCGLKKAKDNDVLLSNSNSVFAASLMSKFVTSNDFGYGQKDGVWMGHNIFILKSDDGLVYLAPYDFDLTAIIRPNYFKNKGASLKDHAIDFDSWLNSPATRSQKTLVLVALKKKLAAMKSIIDNSLLSDTSKARFNEWHRIYGNVIDHAIYSDEPH